MGKGLFVGTQWTSVVSQKYVDEIFAKIVKKINLFGRLIYSAYL